MASGGCLAVPDQDETKTQGGTSSATTVTTAAPRTMPTIDVSQSPPNSDVVETTVAIERQATRDIPAVLSATYTYTGTETHRRSEWGEPMPFWETYSRESEFVLFPPPGSSVAQSTATATAAGQATDGAETDTVMTGTGVPSQLDPMVSVDHVAHPADACWSIDEDLIFEDVLVYHELTPGTRLKRYYWVVTIPQVDCPSPGKHTHTVPWLAPTDEPWTITLRVQPRE